jgi:uncharacterized protein YciI
MANWYVVMSKPTKSRDAEQGREGEHQGWMKAQQDAGRMLFSGPTTDGPGIWVFRGDTKDEVTQLLQTHPWVKDGLRDVSEMYEWRVRQIMGVGFTQVPQQQGQGQR